jgi:WD40 repeat protein
VAVGTLAACVIVGAAVAYFSTLSPRARGLSLEVRLTPCKDVSLGASGVDGMVLVLASQVVWVGEWARGELGTLPIGRDLTALAGAISPDRETLLVVASTRDFKRGVLQVWDLQARALRKTVALPGWTRREVVFDLDRGRVFITTAVPGGTVYRVDVDAATVNPVFGPGSPTGASVDLAEADARPLAVAPDGKSLVIGTWGATIVWDLDRGRERFACPTAEPHDICLHAAVSPDGRQVVCDEHHGKIGLWDFATGARIGDLAWGSNLGKCKEMAFSADGAFLAVGITGGVEEPGYVALWRAADYSGPVISRCHSDQLHSMSFLRGEDRLVTTGDHTVGIWRLPAGNGAAGGNRPE